MVRVPKNLSPTGSLIELDSTTARYRIAARASLGGRPTRPLSLAAETGTSRYGPFINRCKSLHEHAYDAATHISAHSGDSNREVPAAAPVWPTLHRSEAAVALAYLSDGGGGSPAPGQQQPVLLSAASVAAAAPQPVGDALIHSSR